MTGRSTEMLPATALIDRELDLDELLEGLDTTALERLLETVIPGGHLVAPSGKVVAGCSSGAGGEQLAVRYGLETLAFLEFPLGSAAQAAVAVETIQLLLRMSARYLMTSDLHLRAVRDDYLALQEKHAALAESEARYRELSDNLERRVEQQVRTIEKRQRQLFHAEKLASVGRLAAGMAHEINNPIGFMLSNLRTAKSYLEELGAEALSEDQHELLEDFGDILDESTEGAERIAAIIRDLKTFSNVDGAESTDVDIAALLANACEMVRPLTHCNVHYELDGNAGPPVSGRPADLAQAFMNVLLNAAQAMPRGGTVWVGSHRDDGTVKLAVTDEGEGIAEDLLDQVFDPFFTTRDVGEGGGLGLTVARDVVRAHGGDIRITSRPGQGTTVLIEIPVAGADATGAASGGRHE